MSPKSMRSLDEIVASRNRGDYLTADEQRLIDLHLFKSTGKHLEKFKSRKKEDYPNVTLISKDRKANNKKANNKKAITSRKEIPIGGSVSIVKDKNPGKGSKSVS